MKWLKILIGMAFLAVFGLSAYAWYALQSFNDELNRKRTEAARAARWKKDDEGLNEVKHEETKSN